MEVVDDEFDQVVVQDVVGSSVLGVGADHPPEVVSDFGPVEELSSVRGGARWGIAFALGGVVV